MRDLTITVWNGSSETDYRIPLQNVSIRNVVEPRNERIVYKTHYGRYQKVTAPQQFRYELSITLDPILSSLLQSQLQTIIQSALNPSHEVRLYRTKNNNPAIITAVPSDFGSFVHFVPTSPDEIEYAISIQQLIPTVRVSVKLVSDKLYTGPLRFGAVL